MFNLNAFKCIYIYLESVRRDLQNDAKILVKFFSLIKNYLKIKKKIL